VLQYLRQILTLFCRTDTNGTPFAKCSAKDGFYTFVCWLLCWIMSTFIILHVSCLMVQFSFVLMRILKNSWCDWECTGVLQCLSCKIHGKSCCRNKDDTFVLVMAALRSRCGHYIFVLFLSSSFFFSSPNLNRCTLDVYHTSTHDMVLVQI